MEMMRIVEDSFVTLTYIAHLFPIMQLENHTGIIVRNPQWYLHGFGFGQFKSCYP